MWNNPEEYFDWFDGQADRVARSLAISLSDARHLIRQNSEPNVSAIRTFVARVESGQYRPPSPNHPAGSP